MNISQCILLSGSIGVVSSLSLGEIGQSNGDESGLVVIQGPEQAGDVGNYMFSNNGELKLVHMYDGTNSDIYVYEESEWTLIHRKLQAVPPGLTPTSVSDDGSVLLLTNFDSDTRVRVGPLSVSMPRRWFANREDFGINQFWGGVRGGQVSGDGRVVTLCGSERDDHSEDSLVWDGGSDLVSISDGLSRAYGDRFSPGIPNHDGTIIVFIQSLSRNTDTTKIWVWNDGNQIEIPRLDPMIDENRRVIAISSNGDKVFGVDDGRARGGLGFYNALSEQTEWTRPWYHPQTAWVWSESEGIVPIMDRTRFHETNIIDVSDSGDIAIIEARSLRESHWERYLWVGGNEFILIDDLLDGMGLTQQLNGFSFWDISGDGTKLMGAMYEGDRLSAAILTLP